MNCNNVREKYRKSLTAAEQCYTLNLIIFYGNNIVYKMFSISDWI